MASNRTLIVCGAVAMLMIAGNSRADIIMRYEGPLFTDVFPSAGGIDFTTSDRITGTLVFDDITSTEAKSIQLSTTVAGNPGFEFDIPDVLNPGSFNIVFNDFTRSQSTQVNSALPPFLNHPQRGFCVWLVSDMRFFDGKAGNAS